MQGVLLFFVCFWANVVYLYAFQLRFRYNFATQTYCVNIPLYNKEHDVHFNC